MSEHFPLTVAGGGTPAGQYEVRSPFDDSLLGTVETLGEDLAEKAMQTAYGLYRDRSQWLERSRASGNPRAQCSHHAGPFRGIGLVCGLRRWQAIDGFAG